MSRYRDPQPQVVEIGHICVMSAQIFSNLDVYIFAFQIVLLVHISELSKMLKIKRDINQQDSKIVYLHFVKSQKNSLT